MTGNNGKDEGGFLGSIEKGFKKGFEVCSGITLGEGDETVEQETLTLDAGNASSRPAAVTRKMEPGMNLATTCVVDEDRAQKAYQGFLEKLQSDGNPYFLFLDAMDIARELAEGDEKLYRGAAKLLFKQHGVATSQVVGAIPALLTQVENIKTEQLHKFDEKDGVEISGIEEKMSKATDEIAELEKRLIGMRESQKELAVALEGKKQDHEARDACIVRAAEMFNGEIENINRNITTFCKEA